MTGIRFVCCDLKMIDFPSSLWLDPIIIFHCNINLCPWPCKWDIKFPESSPHLVPPINKFLKEEFSPKAHKQEKWHVVMSSSLWGHLGVAFCVALPWAGGLSPISAFACGSLPRCIFPLYVSQSNSMGRVKVHGQIAWGHICTWWYAGDCMPLGQSLDFSLQCLVSSMKTSSKCLLLRRQPGILPAFRKW